LPGDKAGCDDISDHGTEEEKPVKGLGYNLQQTEPQTQRLIILLVINKWMENKACFLLL
jgi:hypothetical protein